MPNSLKSQWFHLQRIPWIGAIFDFKLGMIFVSEKKIVDIITKAEIIIVQSSIAARFLASMVVKVIASVQAVGDIVYLKTHYCQIAIASATCDGWNVDVIVTGEIIDELKFWIDNIRLLNGKPFYFNPCANTIIYSDASATGGASIMMDPLSGKEFVAHCEWSESDSIKSSTFRELSTVFVGLCKFSHLMCNNILDW